MIDGKILNEKLLKYAETFLHLKKRDETYFRNLLLKEFRLAEPYYGEPDLGYIEKLDVPDEIPEEVAATYRNLGFQVPAPIALMALEHQVAQKLHGASDTAESNGRAHDLIDLQLILRGGNIDLGKTRRICERLFALRRRQPWPTPIVARKDWSGIYDSHRRDLDVLPSVAEAVDWANELIDRIVRA
ncbi:MAG: nucleotidyl transferase AbiEii/AbiGii toxin family protein [Clostridia bacterium]|nr:nucleotidyl transferase AbiEii/AbiGii toxin family protein [Clostridia bacterium]